MNIVIIVQARMGSSRLPGKVLKKISGKEMLLFQYERLIKSNKSSLTVIATTTNSIDDSIESICIKNNIPYFRGSESDVLLRYFDTASFFKADAVVRINSDCPFIDPVVVDRVIQSWLDGQPNLDYASNILEETFPLGMHVEVFSCKALERTNKNALKPDEREHVTPYIYRNPAIYKILNVPSSLNLSNYRLTVDYEDDLIFANEVVNGIGSSEMGMMEIIEFLENNKDMMKINCKYKKNQNLL
jgi:spore coat polysaccharide biosynthesis protein SpsF